MSLSQLPTELIVWTGGYLSLTDLASLSFQNKQFRAVFADSFHSFDLISSCVLLRAAEADDTALIELALRNRAAVNHAGLDGRTILSFAAQRGDFEMVQRLLEVKDVDIYSEDASSRSPLSWASKNGHWRVVDVLVAADVDNVQGYIEYALIQATCPKVVERLLIGAAKDHEICSDGGYGEALLCSAAEDGKETMVELYLAARINKNARDDYGRSALYLAGSGFHGGVMERLIKAGADVNMPACDGETPLMQAVNTGHKSGVRIFLSAEGINVNAKNRNGSTALSLAELVGDEKMVDLLRAATSGPAT
jgi:ankyrin repeat protein